MAGFLRVSIAVPRKVPATAAAASRQMATRSIPPPEEPLVRVHLHAQETPADEDVVAVVERALGLDAHVSPVPAVEITQVVAAFALLDRAVSRRHEEIRREIEVAVLAPDLNARAPRAHGHADGAALEHLIQ